MAENSQRDDPVDNPGVKHEPSDVSVRGVLYFGAGLAVFAVIIQVVLWWMFEVFHQREMAANPPTRPWATNQQPRLPPEPRLEGLAPPPQSEQRPQAPEALLRGHGWVDKEKGIVRIPINDAMRLLADKLPSRSSSAMVEQEEPHDSNSGRFLRKGPP